MVLFEFQMHLHSLIQEMSRYVTKYFSKVLPTVTYCDFGGEKRLRRDFSKRFKPRMNANGRESEKKWIVARRHWRRKKEAFSRAPSIAGKAIGFRTINLD
jgi:hypothetical protein